MAEKASSRSLLFARCVIFHFVTLKSSKQSSHTVINLHPCQPGLCCQMALWVNHIRAHARTHTNPHHAEMCNRPRTFCFLQCWMKATKPEESVCNQSSAASHGSDVVLSLSKLFHMTSAMSRVSQIIRSCPCQCDPVRGNIHIKMVRWIVSMLQASASQSV